MGDIRRLVAHRLPGQKTVPPEVGEPVSIRSIVDFRIPMGPAMR